MPPPAGREKPGGHFLVILGRAYGGALFFALPLMMTMEMWRLGPAVPPLRLLLLLALFIPILARLSWHAGFEETSGWRENVRDAFIAYAVGFSASAAVLLLIAALGPGMKAREVVGKVALQAVPASIGAMLARSQLGAGKARDRDRSAQGRYAGELFLMGVGALFLGFNVAPTEEMVLIAHRAGRWHILALLALSVLVMHAFVYAVEFRGHETAPAGVPPWSVFLRYTVVGYALVLLVSLFLLWLFGRTDGAAAGGLVETAVVLGFPGALGAAAARLVL